MDDAAQPWRSPDAVHRLAAEWHAAYAGRRLVRLAGGPGWLRLTLIDDDPAREDSGPPAHLHLVARPGTVLLWDADEVIPHAWDAALGRVPQKQLTPTSALKDARLVSVSAPAEDRIVYLAFEGAERAVVALQLFGPRGNLVLADANGRRLWSAHPSPHPATLEPPPWPGEPGPDPVAPAFRAAAPPRLRDALREETVARARTALRRALQTAERRRAHLVRDLDRADRGDEARRDGETLAIHLHALRRGPDSVTLTDAGGEPRTIALDPALTPAQNMEARFKAARKADRGRETIVARLAAATEHRDALAAAAAAFTDLLAGDGDPLETVPDWRAEHVELLGEAPKPGMKRRVVEETLPFRRYRLDDRWDVWVGRSNAENDELTHRASSPDDWWFHAQGVPGSHVVLRTAGKPDQVPRAILERVAAIAAHHSKARTAGLAPVIYTLRKYVRKPRKTPAGTASCLREKSLMVEPGVPEDEAQ